MKHILDNPVWAALISENYKLSLGNDTARYFKSDVSTFAGVKEFTETNFKMLYDFIPFETPVPIFTDQKLVTAGPWKIITKVDSYQMLYTEHVEEKTKDTEIVKLNEHHVPEMMALTKLTNPGPFLPRTIDFGNYEGILNEGKLVAMAGQRLHSGDFVEISAVCTHPDHLGKGYARQLILNQIRNIQSRKETAYLHVRLDNERAVKIYEKMGFQIRKNIFIYILSKS
ncbi:MAG: GNAT family N-acetyltransferase [Cytophagaceae bacterium]|nr:GNAT family N-acetyltransferase [Cytophagaceae bacterium]